ncbi:DNA-processing protein DprA [Lachnobacterium bovis]|uniref:DNA processing protein n=1 Tax=Lachnobacterium bovis TaxID=140626 RepID=A0A1H9Q7C2_9FIRM|nr:DNA-processing protein DprA [Lachnobacterium bovis]SER56322.1 DNA processing protein [Lachnobacterium bovis]
MKYALWLSNIKGISNGKIKILREIYKNAETIYNLTRDELIKIKGITEKDVCNILSSKDNWNLESKLYQLFESGISFVSVEQEEYPKNLRNIINAPYSLYYKGNLPQEENKSVAIVGARTRSQYGSQVAARLARLLADSDINVISGLARGIDADAHLGALSSGKDGRTFAILGCGINICYPKQNQYIYDKIISQGGGIISEYWPDTKPLKTLFPSRNRIIAGISDCTVVIEARQKSGSLITADYAMEQGKDVYALPGRVTDELSFGCNYLIKQGAGVIVSPEDFLNEFNSFYENLCSQINFYEKLLEKDELLVYSLLDFTPTNLGTIIEKSSMNLLEILEILEHLKQKGYIKEIMSNHFVRCI